MEWAHPKYATKFPTYKLTFRINITVPFIIIIARKRGKLCTTPGLRAISLMKRTQH